MCRLAAYVGPPISLDAFLLQPDHSLVKQAWQPREMNEATLNADGFGIAWYNDDGRTADYKNSQPIWSDPNLEPLSRSLIRRRWLASIRSATLINDVSHANTQPFCNSNLLFAHNGYLKDFRTHWRSRLREILFPEFESIIHGTTDSEYLFALYCQYLEQKQDPVAAIRALIETLDQLSDGVPALLNIIVSTPNKMISLRHAIAGDCPSLYYHRESTDGGNAVRVASEALNSDDAWTAIDENQIILIDDNAKITSETL